VSTGLTIKTRILDNKCIVDLEGHIDEDSDFGEILELDMECYHFNFEKVEMINSCGIREWITFLGKLKPSCKVSYLRCPQVIIEQMNMVNGFVKDGAQIESFYAPYYCENCDSEKAILVKTKDVSSKKAPKVKCEECENEMEFDGLEDQYFNFM